jgi:hypothetical protein
MNHEEKLALAREAVEKICQDLNLRRQEVTASFPEELATPATDDRISIQEVIKSAERFASGEDLFSKWFFGESAIDELVATIKRNSEVLDQNRAYIGLVQATMMGTLFGPCGTAR